MYFVSILIAIILIAVPVVFLFNSEQWRTWYWGPIVASGLVMAQSLYTGPMYHVWQQQLEGKAELQKAEWNRQIVIQEAEAKKEAANSWADAEVIRARGSNEANAIMAESLGGNENYLRWLWIDKIDKIQGGQVIYLPADGGMPIMEAAKRK
jgi:hypothetical protein